MSGFTLWRGIIFVAVILAAGSVFLSAADPAGKLLIDAEILQARTSSHSYSALTIAATGAKTEIAITMTPSAEFIKVGSQWRKSASSPEQRIKDHGDEAAAGHGLATGQRIDEENVNGEPSTLYSFAKKDNSVTGKYWISNRSGLPVKTEIDLNMSSGKQHISARNEFGNLQPPPGVK